MASGAKMCGVHIIKPNKAEHRKEDPFFVANMRIQLDDGSTMCE